MATIGDFEAAMQRVLNATFTQRDDAHLFQVVRAGRLQMMGEVMDSDDEAGPIEILLARYETPEQFESEWLQRIKRIK